MGAVAGSADDGEAGAVVPDGAGEAVGEDGVVHRQHYGGRVAQAKALDRIALGDVAEDDAVAALARGGDRVDIALDREVAAAVGAEHVGDQPADPPEAEDHGHARRVLGAAAERVGVDPPRQPPAERGEQRGDGEAERRDDGPEARLVGAEDAGGGGGAEDDQGQLGRAREEQRGLDRHPAAASAPAQQPHDHRRLGEQHRRQRAEQRGPLRDDGGEVEPQPDGDQEDAEREAAEGRGDDLDLGMIVGLGDQYPGEQCAEAGAEADTAGGEAAEHQDEQADREEQLGALGPRGLGEQHRQEEAAGEQQAGDHREVEGQRPEQGGPARPSVEHEQDGDKAQILEQQDGERDPADAAGGPGDGEDQGGRAHRQREPEHDPAAAARAESPAEPAEQQRGQQHLRAAQPEHRLAHRAEALEAHLKPDGEEEEEDAELGEGLDGVGIGDADRAQPRPALRPAAEQVRAAEHADEDEAEHRRDPEPREGRDDDPRRAEHGQRVRQRRTEVERVRHAAFKP